MEERGTFKDEDEAAIDHYFDIVSMLRECKRDIKEHGLYFSLPNGNYQKNPAAEHMATLLREKRMLIIQLGLSPAARKKVDTEEEEESDGFPD